MSKLKSLNVANAAEEVSRIMRFEHWVRFYHLVEKDGELRVEISDEMIEAMKEDAPDLVPLAELMNNDTIDFQKSQTMLCAFVARLDGNKYSTEVMPKVFDSKDLKLEMYVFSLWIKGHEGYLDENYKTFGDWEELYGGWNSQDEVKTYRKKLWEQNPNAMEMPDCGVQ